MQEILVTQKIIEMIFQPHNSEWTLGNPSTFTNFDQILHSVRNFRFNSFESLDLMHNSQRQ